MTAGRFISAAASPDIVVDLGTPTEAIRTNGFVWREYTSGTATAAIPVAYGTVSTPGVVLGGTGNFTVTKVGTGQYSILIDGESYGNNTFVVSASPVTPSPRFTTITDNGAPFLVNIWNTSGVLTDTGFQFIVWAANPSNPG